MAWDLGYSVDTHQRIFRKHFPSPCLLTPLYCSLTKSVFRSATSMIDLFGRLPVHERQWVKNVIAVPGGGSAYMSNGIVVFQGPVGTPSVFQHETGHAVDFYARDTQSSATTEWTNAEAADSCVPDGYANSSKCTCLFSLYIERESFIARRS